jgi:DNA-binding transcriptional ArsR family regulator
MATKSPTILWEYGTAYELVVSLYVLHETEAFGIRPSFAAGVRSRIPAPERKLLEDVFPILGLPFKWIHNLPSPRDAISALWALKQIPPADRMIKMQGLDDDFLQHGKDPKEYEKYRITKETLLRIAGEGKWNPGDLEYFQKMIGKKHDGLKREAIERCLDWWSKPEELGEGFLSALQSYYQEFFEEEEKRIEPILREGLAHAQSRASKLNLDDLFLELSQGVKLDDDFRAPKFIFAPAFWSTPLILFDRIDPDTMLILFGARPANMSVVPGEVVPDGLVRALKALADPTRLKILNYLSKEELAPSELARRLKLRAPTVTHHMSELRLAGLVNVNIQGQDKKYTVRSEAIDAIHNSLKDFLSASDK